MLKETDALGNETIYAYDALSRLTQVTDPLQRVTKYNYDGADNIVSVIDGNSHITKYEYNTKGLLTKETNALGNVEQYEYYVDGLLKNIIKADGTTSSYKYDAVGRMTDVKYSDGTAIEYGHNEMGTVTTMVDKTGTTTYQYDDMQHLISTTDSNDKTVKYEYDILGRRTAIVLPDGQKTSYEYDNMDRLTKVLGESGTIAQYDYDANSQLVSNVRNDITTTYDYNELGQLETMTTSDVNSQLQKFTYQYDAMGNIVEEIRTEQNAVNNRTYEYDSANQLTKFADNDYDEKYTYDNVGNMLTKDVNGALTSYVYNEANQMITETFEDKTIKYIYNQNGDLVEKSIGEKYTYDIQGNLTAIKGNGIDQSFTYNGVGKRLSETIGEETVYYVNDINRVYEQVLQTYDADGSTINTYTYGVQRINSQGKDNETYLYDGGSSVAGSVSEDNKLISYSYTAYGDLMPSSSEPISFGFNAEATDFATGIQYIRARYYDTTIGRFIQEDKYRGEQINPKSMHRYMYVYNNPVNYVDLSGFRPIEMTTHNRHTMKQLKKTTKADLMKEYEAKKLLAIAKSQDIELRRLQEIKESDIGYANSNAVNGGGSRGVQTPAISLEETIANCTFDQVNAMIDDDMDFSIYSISELQSLYDKIDALDVGKKAFDNVNNKNKFMRQLKRYIKDNTPKLVVESSINWGQLARGALMVGVGVLAVATVVATGGAAVALIAPALGALGAASTIAATVAVGSVAVAGGVAATMGVAEIGESVSGTNHLKDAMGEELYSNVAFASTLYASMGTAFLGQLCVPSTSTSDEKQNTPGNNNQTTTVYRGEKSSVTPETTFENGFETPGTHNDPLLHTQSNATRGDFVSTSTEMDIATDFAGKNGYVYEIQTNNYVDINSTYGNAAPYPEQMEYSIPGGIPASDVVGAYPKSGGTLTGEFIPNPNFKGN